MTTQTYSTDSGWAYAVRTIGVLVAIHTNSLNAAQRRVFKATSSTFKAADSLT